MSSDLSEVIQQIMHDQGFSEELVIKTIEDMMLAAYKKKYGTSENAVVRFREGNTGVDIYAKKMIVEEVDDHLLEISLEEAKTHNKDSEIGDFLELSINPNEFDFQAVRLAKHTVHNSMREISQDTQYAEYRSKVGEIIIGYYQRERNGNIYVNLGKVEGLFPKKYQSPRESYHPNDRIKAMIAEVQRSPSGTVIVLSRTHADFVKKVLELEVPEVYDKAVEVFKIVREPGFRTKIAVFSNREDIDPVGACVGIKGIRIQAIIRELEGEKVDILKYDIDPKRFIRNALSPAEVKDVYILDEAKHQALAVVADSQFSAAIGKQGFNVRLADRLCDWKIDVKTETQFAQMERSTDLQRAVSDLFKDHHEATGFSSLPGFKEEWIEALLAKGIQSVEDFLALDQAQLDAIDTIDKEDILAIQKLIEENIEIVDESSDEVDLEEEGSSEDYHCPDCGTIVTVSMTHCPNCNVELSFEYEDE